MVILARSLLDPRWTREHREQVRRLLLPSPTHTPPHALTRTPSLAGTSRPLSAPPHWQVRQALSLTLHHTPPVTCGVCAHTHAAAAFGLVITTLTFYLARNMTDEGCVGCGDA